MYGTTCDSSIADNVSWFQTYTLLFICTNAFSLFALVDSILLKTMKHGKLDFSNNSTNVIILTCITAILHLIMVANLGGLKWTSTSKMSIIVSEISSYFVYLLGLYYLNTLLPLRIQAKYLLMLISLFFINISVEAIRSIKSVHVQSVQYEFYEIIVYYHKNHCHRFLHTHDPIFNTGFTSSNQ